MPRKDPEAYREYMRNYMRKRQGSKKHKGEETMEESKQDKDDFNVSKAVLPEGDKELDLNGKTTKQLLETAKKASKDPDTEEEDPVFKYIEKGMKYLPIIMEAIKGFQSSQTNFQTQQQPQQPKIQPPEGWETMTPLQRLSKKYRDPAWYEAGERYDELKAQGAVGNVGASPVNTQYVDPTYNQAVAQRQAQQAQQQQQEARSLEELKSKHPEPPMAKDAQPERAQVEKPEFIEKAEEKRGQSQDTKEAPQEENQMLINAMREDNNKYIEMAFNWLGGLEQKQFEEYVNNIDKFKPKMQMLKLLLPVQTKEMLKATTSSEFVETFKAKCPEKHKWLKDNKKISEMKKLFEELKNSL